MLTEEQLLERRNSIGGSDARKILSGDWLSLYNEKKGIAEPEFTKDQIFLMDLGTAAEPVIRDRWLKSDGLDYIDEGTSIAPNYTIQSPDKHFMRCNIDTVIMPKYLSAFIQEIKFHTGMKDIEELADDYYGQTQHNMYCYGSTECHFTVGFGAWGKYGNLIVPRNDEFIEHYVQLCEKFWWHVENNVPPDGEISIKDAPEAPAWTKVVDMTGNNAWADAVNTYECYAEGAKLFDESKKIIKECMPEDAGIAYGHGIKAKRDKRGAVRISKLTEMDKLKFDKQKEKAA